MKLICKSCILALGNKQRIQIYYLLNDIPKGLDVGSICKFLKIKQPTVSHHLTILKEVGLLTSYKKGRFVYYKVSNICPHTKKSCVL